MLLWSTLSTNKRWGLWALLFLLSLGGWWAAEAAVGTEREPVTLRVVAVNPSAEKSQTVPVRIDLPQEVKPSDVLERGELAIEFDDERSLYYVYKPNVTLAPKQARTFEVVVRDLWFVPNETLESLKQYAQILSERLKSSEYQEAAQKLADSITTRLVDIEKMQVDETIGRKQRIGAYRHNLQTLQEIKDDLARMEKLLSFAGGVPVPEMLEESPLKSDAPSTTTTWLIIFLVVIFMGLLAGQFFFTWQRRLKSIANLDGAAAGFPASSKKEESQLGSEPIASGRTPPAS